MVLTNNNTPTPTTTPDTDHDTPPHAQPFTPFSFSSTNHHRQQLPPYFPAATYKECLKNHAANLGGHALDGCGEFMPSPTATHTDPTSLACAACGCHRNFHRREATDEYFPFIAPSMMTTHFIDFRHPRRSSSSPSSPPPQPPPLPQPQTILTYPPPPHMLLALSSASQDDQQVPNHQFPTATRDAKAADKQKHRKRFRTKFSQEQKKKMHSFAERLGWKMQRCDQAAVESFCNEIGVAKGVLKVWMHNNKSNLGNKKDSNNSPIMTAAVNGEGDINNINPGIDGYSIHNNDGDDDDDDEKNIVNHESGVDHDMGNGNGSSSSS